MVKMQAANKANNANADNDLERRPLLSAESRTKPQAGQEQDDDDDKNNSLPPTFPYFRFGILMAIRLAEPISFSVIFPFINPMVEELTGPENVGLYAGLIESLFMATQCCTLLYWGAASDRSGRKPILLTGLMGSATSIVLFGFSKFFWWAVIARCLAGALNGNVAVVKSMAAEMVPKEHHPVAFSCLSVVWSMGVTIGPFLGGFLSQPAQVYPDTFGAQAPLGFGGLWETYPYLLPCLAAGCTTLAAITLGLLQLEETLPRIVKKRQKQREEAERARRISLRIEAPTEEYEAQGDIQEDDYDHDVDRRLTRSPSASESDARPVPKRLSRLSSWYDTFGRRATAQDASPSSSGTGTPDPALQRCKSQRFKPKIGRVSSFYSGFTPTVSQVPSPSHTPTIQGREGRQGIRDHAGGDETNAEAIQSSSRDQADTTVPEAIQRLNESGIQDRQVSEATATPAPAPASASAASAPAPSGDGTITSILKSAHIQRLLLTQAFLSLTMVAWDSMQVLFFFEPVSIGGLALTPSQTGLILSLSGFLGMLSQICIFPPAQRLLGSLRLYRLALCVLPLSVVFLPLSNVIARKEHLSKINRQDWQVWTPIALAHSLRLVSAMGFASNMLLVNHSASLFRTVRLGTLNALAQMAASASRAVGPVCFASLLSWTFAKQVLRGYFAWGVLALIACGGFVTSLGLLDVERMISAGEVMERIEGQDEDDEEITEEVRREQQQQH